VAIHGRRGVSADVASRVKPVLREEGLHVPDLAAVVLSEPHARGVLRRFGEPNEHPGSLAIIAKLDAGVRAEFVGMDKARVAAEAAVTRDADGGVRKR